MNKIICESTETENGTFAGTISGEVVSYFIAPTVKEMVEKINELVDWVNNQENGKNRAN